MDVVVLKGSVTGRMTDDEFLRLCLDNPDLRIERNSNLEIQIMSPVGSLSGSHSAEIIRQLSNWSLKDGHGITFDASTGFTLKDRSILSPDAAWMRNEKWDALTNEEKEKFAPVCPEFIIEVRSKSDRIEDLIQKMEVWIKNGAQLGWLIDPRAQVTYLFRPDGTKASINGFNGKISGEGPVAGFELDLSLLRL